MMGNQPKPRYRKSKQNTRKVERSAFGILLHDEFLTPHEITQKHLSKVSGIAAEDISRMVTGDRYPYDPTLYDNLYDLFKALAELGVPITDNQVHNVLQVKEIQARLNDKRQAELIAALQAEGVVKVADQPTQREADALYRAAVQSPPIQESPKIDNLPFQPNPFFTGRETELEQIRQQLQETSTAMITQPVSISGLGGIGKTELALEYAHRFYPNVYRVALWVDADTPTLQTSYANLAEVLKLPERDEQNLDRRILAVKDWLKTHTNWLLIMDNVDDLQLARSSLPSKPLGHVVFTTQSQIIGTTSTRDKHIEIEVMGSNDGLLLLLRRSHMLEGKAPLNTVTADIRETARQLVELLGGHTLALDQAGAYIEETGVSFADYIKLYQKKRRFLLDRRGSPCATYEHPESVAATVLLSVSKACEQHPMAEDVLYFCSYCSPDNIPEAMLLNDDELRLDAISFNEVIAALRGYSLIKRSAQDKSLSMHRLVQAVLKETLSLSPELKAQVRDRVVLSIILTGGTDWRDKALFYERQGKYGKAGYYYQGALTFLEPKVGANHPLVKEIRNDYAALLHKIWHDAEAAALDVNDEPSV